MSALRRHFRPVRVSVGLFHAKTHLSALLDRVARGEEITITKHDRPVARLVSVDRPSQETVAGVFRQMDELRRGLPRTADNATLKDLVNEGRRF